MTDTEWYWCLHHGRAEDGEHLCPVQDRLGPYPTKDDAENWRQRLDDRNRKWDAEDRAWEGDE